MTKNSLWLYYILPCHILFLSDICNSLSEKYNSIWNCFKLWRYKHWRFDLDMSATFAVSFLFLLFFYLKNTALTVVQLTTDYLLMLIVLKSLLMLIVLTALKGLLMLIVDIVHWYSLACFSHLYSLSLSLSLYLSLSISLSLSKGLVQLSLHVLPHIGAKPSLIIWHMRLVEELMPGGVKGWWWERMHLCTCILSFL